MFSYFKYFLICLFSVSIYAQFLKGLIYNGFRSYKYGFKFKMLSVLNILKGVKCKFVLSGDLFDFKSHFITKCCHGLYIRGLFKCGMAGQVSACTNEHTCIRMAKLYKIGIMNCSRKQ